MRSIFSLSACILFVAACRPTPTPTPGPATRIVYVDTISAKGCFFTGEGIPFYGNIKVPTSYIRKMSWNFGDGSPLEISTTPSHVYHAPGTYRVQLTVNDQVVAKDVTISDRPSSSLAAATNGTRQWEGTGTGVIRELDYKEIFGTGTNFSQKVQIWGASTTKLYIFNAELSLTGVNETAKTLTFTDCGENTRKLVYYYELDSMTYSSNWHTGERGGKLEIHTP